MRSFVSVGLVFAACGGGVPGAPSGDDDPTDPLTDAGVILDAPSTPDAPADAPPTPATVFESATLTPGPFDPLRAQSTNGEQLLGVRFTTTKPLTITGLGAHVFRICHSCTGDSQDTQFMAIVPIDTTTNLPTTLDVKADAIGYGLATIPYVTSTATTDIAPPSTVFTTSFELPAGTWGLVIGGGYYDTQLIDISLSSEVSAVGDPKYIYYAFENQQWWYGQNAGPHKRMFVLGH